MNIKESELRKKLDLVVDKLLNLGGPDAGSGSVWTAEDHAV